MLNELAPEWVVQMVKYAIKGGTGMIVNVALLTFVVDIIGVSKALGVPVVWVATLIPSYLFVDRWVFKLFPSPDGLTANVERSVAFYAIMWSGKGINYVLYLVLIHVGFWYQAAWIAGAIVVFPFNFAANRWVWQRDLRLREVPQALKALTDR